MLILECVEQKKKKNAGDQMGWATAHLQFCVATLQWCDDRRGAAHKTGTPTRTTEDLSMRAHGGLPREACRDRPPWVLCRNREFSITTELSHPLS